MASDGIPMEVKRYQCDSCPKSFDIYSTYYSHRRSHIVVNLKCRACDNTYPTHIQRLKHYYNAHGEVVHTKHRKTEEVVPKRKSTLTSSWALH